MKYLWVLLLSIGTAQAATPLFPSNNVWNVSIDNEPIHPRSTDWMQNWSHGGHPLHADFGSVYDGRLNGIPYNIVDSNTPKMQMIWRTDYNYKDESDPLPAEGLPVPYNVLIEGDPQPWNPDGDHHLILLEGNILHELYGLVPIAFGSWAIRSYTRWDLSSNALRPEGWTSADAAGLPVLPGLVTYQEVQSGEIRHALRFTLELVWSHIWPARHDANSGDERFPPFGMRVRLKKDVDISAFSKDNQVILRALKKYGMYLADNGGDWFISGVPDSRWDNEDLHMLHQIIPGDAFEVVDMHPVNVNSAEYGSSFTLFIN